MKTICWILTMCLSLLFAGLPPAAAQNQRPAISVQSALKTMDVVEAGLVELDKMTRDFLESVNDTKKETGDLTPEDKVAAYLVISVFAASYVDFADIMHDLLGQLNDLSAAEKAQIAEKNKKIAAAIDSGEALIKELISATEDRDL